MKKYIENNYSRLFKVLKKFHSKQKKFFQYIKNWIFLHQKPKFDYSRFTIIVSRYNENLCWLKNVKYPYVVYNKGKNNLPPFLKNVISLPNIGREAGTYLDFIINNYDKLPEYTVFLQGYPFDHSSNLFKKLNEFEGESDFVDLSDYTFECNGKGWPHPEFIDMETTSNILYGRKIDKFIFGAGAQFLVHKKNILSHSLKTYSEIYNYCKVSPALSDKFSPWAIERIWRLLLEDKEKTVFDN